MGKFKVVKSQVNTPNHPGTLKKAGNEPAEPGIFFQPDARIAISPGHHAVDENHDQKLPVDHKIGQYKGQAVEEEGKVKKAFIHWRWVFESTNALFVLVEIAVVAITGWIKQKVQDDKNPEQAAFAQVGPYTDAKKVNRKKKVGERKKKKDNVGTYVSVTRSKTRN